MEKVIFWVIDITYMPELILGIKDAKELNCIICIVNFTALTKDPLT